MKGPTMIIWSSCEHRSLTGTNTVSQDKGGQFARARKICLMYSNTRPEQDKRNNTQLETLLRNLCHPSVTGELLGGSSQQQDQSVPEGGTRAHRTDLANTYWTFSHSFLGLEDVLLGKQSSGFCFCACLCHRHAPC